MNSIIDFFVRRPVTTSMVVIGFSLWGFIALNFLPVSLMPPSESPALTIVTRYPGTSPSKIEESLTKPIEEQIVGVGGIESIYSTSEEGESRVNVSFVSGSKIAKISLEIRARIDLIRGSFSREVEEPQITRYDPSDRPVFIIKLESDKFSLKELRDIAENKIKKRLERVDGISEINVGGGFQREINVEIDRNKLNFLQIKIANLLDQIRRANINLPAGKLFENDKWVSIRVVGKFDAVEKIKSVTVIVPSQDKIVRLGDVAEVKDGFREKENISRENGKEIVSIYVQKAGDANTLSVCDGLAEELSEFKFPGINATITYNQSEYIRSSINRVSNSAIYGGMIAVIVLFLFLKNIRATIAVSIAIPLSVIATFAVMQSSKVGIHIMSLSGLALGIGMMVDSSIVVLDSIFFKMEKEGFRENIAGNAVKSVSGELFASVITNIAVFFPILFSSIELQQLYGGLAMTVSSSLLISLLVSLIVLPVLANRLFRKEIHFNESNLYHKILGLTNRIYSKFPANYQKIRLNMKIVREKYVLLLRYALANQRLIFTISLVVMFVATSLVFTLKQEYIDPLDTGEIKASVELETGTHLEATDKRIFKVEEIFRTYPQVERVSSKVEKWHADIYIKLKSNESRKESASQMIDLFKVKTDTIGDAFVYYVEVGGGDESRELDIEFVGDDGEVLKKLAKEASAVVSKIPGIQQVALRFREGKNELRLDFDHEKASTAGISASEFGSTLKTAIQGSIPTKYIDDGKEVDIKVRFREEDRSQLSQVFDYLIPGKESNVFMAALVTQSEAESESKIYRKNKRKVVSITAKLGELDLGNAVKKISAELDNIEYPPNYYYDFGGNYKKLKKNQIEMLLLVSLAFFLIYCILAALFESFSYPVIIIVSIPFAVAGVIIALFIFNLSLNISVYIGLVMLIGIVVNNAILLIEQFIRKVQVDSPKNRSDLELVIVNSSLDRLRPILITTLTTVLGLLPTAFDMGEGSQLWRPLAITVVSGLTISTFLTLILVPLIFFRFYSLKNELTR